MLLFLALAYSRDADVELETLLEILSVSECFKPQIHLHVKGSPQLIDFLFLFNQLVEIVHIFLVAFQSSINLGPSLEILTLCLFEMIAECFQRIQIFFV